VKRILQMLLLFVIFLTILFFLLNAQPGDISRQFLGNPNIPPEAKEMLRHQLGLDRPLVVQYLYYIKDFFTLNLGVSFDRYPQSVTSIIMQALPRTVYLFLTATVLSYLVGFQTGKLVAWRRDTFVEKVTMVTSIVLYTVFYPWFAILMLWFFGAELGWFPLGKFLDPSKWLDAPYTANHVFGWILGTLAFTIAAVVVTYAATRQVDPPRRRKQVRNGLLLLLTAAIVVFWMTNPMLVYALDIAYHTILPVITLTLVFYAGITLLTRSSMLDTLREDYIFTARAKGVPERQIRDRHAARNALLPVTTSFVLAIAFVIGGGIVTETVFSWPGIGLLLLQAVTVEDIPVAMGALAFIGVLALVAHLVADILYAVLDPRIRVGS